MKDDLQPAAGSPGAPAVIEIQGVSFSVGRREILSDVSFEVPRGSFVSVVGPNGAGKTTLLRCITSVVRDWTGQILVEGRPVRSFRRKELARLLSYVPQSDEMVFPFTGRELVLMGRYPYMTPFSRPGQADLEAVSRTIEATGIAGIADRDFRTLSGGERQKVLIAGALAQESGIMLLDEPTTFLDPRHTDEILAVLDGLNRSGVTIVMVTHDVNHAVLYADRIVALVRGRLEFDGPPEEFMGNDVLEAVYGKRFSLVPHPVSGRRMLFPGPGAP